MRVLAYILSGLFLLGVVIAFSLPSLPPVGGKSSPRIARNGGMALKRPAQGDSDADLRNAAAEVRLRLQAERNAQLRKKKINDLLEVGTACSAQRNSTKADAVRTDKVQQEDRFPPAPHGYVTDEAGAMSLREVRRLNAQLKQFEDETGHQVVVAVYPTLPAGYKLADYGTQVFTAWRIGQKAKNDNAALLLLFTKDQKQQITSGNGLTGLLPDALCKRIIEDEITPRLNRGDYDAGVRAGVQAIMAAANGEYRKRRVVLVQDAAKKCAAKDYDSAIAMLQRAIEIETSPELEQELATIVATKDADDNAFKNFVADAELRVGSGDIWGAITSYKKALAVKDVKTTRATLQQLEGEALVRAKQEYNAAQQVFAQAVAEWQKRTVTDRYSHSESMALAAEALHAIPSADGLDAYGYHSLSEVYRSRSSMLVEAIKTAQNEERRGLSQERLALLNALADEVAAIDGTLTVPSTPFVVDVKYSTKFDAKAGTYQGQLSDRFTVDVIFIYSDGSKQLEYFSPNIYEAVPSARYQIPTSLEGVIAANKDAIQRAVAKVSATRSKEVEAFMKGARRSMKLIAQMKALGIRESDGVAYEKMKSVDEKVARFEPLAPEEMKDVLRSAAKVEFNQDMRTMLLQFEKERAKREKLRQGGPIASLRLDIGSKPSTATTLVSVGAQVATITAKGLTPVDIGRWRSTPDDVPAVWIEVSIEGSRVNTHAIRAGTLKAKPISKEVVMVGQDCTIGFVATPHWSQGEDRALIAIDFQIQEIFKEK